MDLNLKDKTFIVTGGASGIGAAISLRLAGEGAIPLICGKDTMCARFEAQLMELQPRPATSASTWSMNRHAEMVARAAADCGHIDGLVNNAGINDGVGLEAGRDAFVRSLQANLVHYYVMAHHCLPHLKASRGSIVNISSKTALTGRARPAATARPRGPALADARMGCRAGSRWRARQCRGARGGGDADVPALAGPLRRPRAPAGTDQRPDSAGPAHDGGRGDCGHGRLSSVRAGIAHHGAMAVRRWRLHPPGPRADLTTMETPCANALHSTSGMTRR